MEYHRDRNFGEPIPTDVPYAASEYHQFNHPPGYSLVDEALLTNLSYTHTITSPPHPCHAVVSESDQSGHKAGVESTYRTKWVWEYVALTLATISMIAQVIILKHVDGLLIFDWTFSISPNAMISILAGIARVCLGFAISSCLGQAKWNWFRRRSDQLLAFERFDDASRGPWGSFRLIAWVKASHWVAIGATAAILLLGFGPFLQAILSFNGGIDSSRLSIPAKLGRNSNLDVGTYFTNGYALVFILQLPDSNITASFSAYTSIPDLGMVSAINNGFYGSKSVPQQSATFTCSTGNCTWDEFATLAVCARCNDITSHVKRYTEFGTNLGTIGFRLGTLETQYTINALPLVRLSNPTTDIGDARYSAFMSATRINNPGLTLSFQNSTTMITAIQVIKADERYEKNQIKWHDTPVTATECALSFCVNIYNSSVEQGSLVERISSSFVDRDLSTYKVIDHSVSNPTQEDAFDRWNNHSLYTGDGDWTRSNLAILVPDEILKRLARRLEIDVPEYARNHTSQLSVDESVPSGSKRAKLELTQSTIGSTVRFVNDDFFVEKMAWPLQGDNAMYMYSPPVIQSLYHSADLSATFENVARSMTNWMRDHSNETQYGVVEEWVVRFRVEWPYIAVPVLTVVLGLVFCIWSIVNTANLGLDPWKTNLIAMLTHSVDEETRMQLKEAYLHGYLDNAARAARVKLDDAGGVLELKAKME